MLYMRNKQTSEVKDVAPDSPEFEALKAQVGPDGRSLWEQTGSHDVDATAQRAAAGMLTEEDLGKEARTGLPAVAVNVSDVGPAKAPWLELTAAEIEAGITPEQKASEVADDIHEQSQGREDTFSEVADHLAGDGTPAGFPINREDGDSGDGDDGEPEEDVELEDLPKAQLVTMAETRGLATSGNKADLADRIEEYDGDPANNQTTA